MYCTQCQAKIPPGANFCQLCGSPVNAASAAAEPVSPTPPSSGQKRSLVTPVAPESAPAPAGALMEQCPWCGAPVEAAAHQTSCPRCGASLQVRTKASRSSWLELPPRKDMAKLQFGRSSCQIEGLYVPVADMNLAAEDGIYFSHHVLLWMEPQIQIETMSLRQGWKRMFAGLPLIMCEAKGPGHIAFSKDEPGELIALPLQPGQEIDVREHMFLVATANVQYDWFQTQIWYRVQEGNDNRTVRPIGMFMDRFTAPEKPGLLLLHAGGTVLVRELSIGESILVKPTALIFKDPAVQMQLHMEHPRAVVMWRSYTNRAIWLRLSGPGRVAIQSVFERLEQEGGNITSHSYASSQQW